MILERGEKKNGYGSLCRVRVRALGLSMKGERKIKNRMEIIEFMLERADCVGAGCNRITAHRIVRQGPMQMKRAASKGSLFT